MWERHFPDHPNPCPDQASTRLLDFVLSYIDSRAGELQPETILEYRQSAETVAAGMHNPTIDKLDRAKFRTWVAAQNLSKSRIDNLLTPVRGAFSQAVGDGALTKSPLEKLEVKRVKEPGDTIDPFTPAEVAELGKVDGGELWTAWAWTGLRSGEVIGLRKGDVDLRASTLRIRRAVRRGRVKVPKTEAGNRIVALLPPAKAAIAKLVNGDPDAPLFVNPQTGGSWHEAKALNRSFARACRKAKVRRRYAYQLRHTYATWALSSGENPAWIANQMGHKDVQVIYDHYAKWMPQLDPKAGSRMLDAVKSKARRRQRAA